MTSFSKLILRVALVIWILPLGLTGCKASSNESSRAANQPAVVSADTSNPSQTADDAPPPEKTGGFDGKRAFAHVAKQVGFGPRPSGSPAIAQVQEYLLSELKSYGCTVETDAFTSDTPIGRLAMKNIVVKIPGEKPGVILLGTHYDTARSARDPRTGEVHPMPTFVGADDAGSSTALMLEVVRLLCAQHGKYAVWIAFFDGEEAMHDWSDTDSRYGSRQMAARLSTNGDRQHPSRGSARAEELAASAHEGCPPSLRILLTGVVLGGRHWIRGLSDAQRCAVQPEQSRFE